MKVVDVLKLRWDGVIFLAGQQLWAFDAATAPFAVVKSWKVQTESVQVTLRQIHTLTAASKLVGPCMPQSINGPSDTAQRQTAGCTRVRTT
eukprot:253633-Rhodomonas_salina.1